MTTVRDIQNAAKRAGNAGSGGGETQASATAQPAASESKAVDLVITLGTFMVLIWVLTLVERKWAH